MRNVMRGYRRMGIGFVVLIMGVMDTPLKAESPYEVEWVTQSGTTQSVHFVESVNIDSMGNIVTLGTYNSYSYLYRHDSSGEFQWVVPIEIPDEISSYSHSVTTDASGNIYVGGQVYGKFKESDNGFSNDIDGYIAKYDSNGLLVDSFRLGTDETDQIESIMSDDFGHLYACGHTEGSLGGEYLGKNDVFLVKYELNGQELWRNQLATDQIDFVVDLAVDRSGNVYMTGTTRGDLGAPIESGDRGDAYVAKYNSAGDLLWVEQFGDNKMQTGVSVAVDDMGDIFVAGISGECLYECADYWQRDTFLTKYNADGDQLWYDQFGSGQADLPGDMVITGQGHAIVAGYTPADLADESHGGYDAFWAEYDTDGNRLWIEQLGTVGDDKFSSMALDGEDHLVIAGSAYGWWTNDSYPTTSLLLIQYAIPEPVSLLFVGLGGLILAGRRRGEI